MIFVFPPALGPVSAVVLIISSALCLLLWHIRNTAFQCQQCEKVFSITIAPMLLSPHLGTEKLLRCPQCGVVSWCRFVSKQHIMDQQRSVSTKRDELSSVQPSRLFRFQMGIVWIAYILLLANTFRVYINLPEMIPIHFGLSGIVDGWGKKGTIFVIPAFASVMPIIHTIVFLYGRKHGYGGFVYWLITTITILGLLLLVAIESIIESRSL